MLTFENCYQVSGAVEERNKWMADGPILLTTSSHTNVSHTHSLANTGDLSFAVSTAHDSLTHTALGREGGGGKGGTAKGKSFSRKVYGVSTRRSGGAGATGQVEREGGWDGNVAVEGGREGKTKAARQQLLQHHQNMAYARSRGSRDVVVTTSDLWALEVTKVCSVFFCFGFFLCSCEVVASSSDF